MVSIIGFGLLTGISVGFSAMLLFAPYSALHKAIQSL